MQSKVLVQKKKKNEKQKQKTKNKDAPKAQKVSGSAKRIYIASFSTSCCTLA